MPTGDMAARDMSNVMTDSGTDTARSVREGAEMQKRRYSSTQDARRKAAARVLCVVAAASLLLAVVAALRQATVNGRAMPMLRALTVADCASRTGVSQVQGDLVDVTGAVLKRGAGRPPVFVVNNVAVSADTPVGPGDVVEISPGGNRIEAVRQAASFITPEVATDKGVKRLPWLRASGVGGIKYVWRGRASGKIAGIQLAALSPVHGGAPGRRKRLALTFDDGPNTRYTPKILEVLAKHNAHATFFVLGVWAPKYPEVLRQTVAGGHEFGCHSWSHPDFTKLSEAAMRREIERWEAVVEPVMEGRARYFRPPYGAVNSRVRRVVNSMGYTVAMWSGDTSDWRRPGSNAIYRRAMSAARDGAIILMHDGGGPREQTVAAVKRMVPDLQARGYRLVTLSELHRGTDPWDDEFVIHTGSGDLRLKPGDAEMRLVVNGQEATMPVPPVEVEGQLLLPAKPALPLLGCSVRYDKASQRLSIQAPVYHLELDMNLRMMRVGSEQVWMLVPPVFYRGNCMVPLWVLMDYCGADVNYDPLTKTLHLWGTYASNAPIQLRMRQTGRSSMGAWSSFRQAAKNETL